MGASGSTIKVSDGDPFVVPSGLVDMVLNGTTKRGLCRVLWAARLAADSQYGPYCGGRWVLVAADDYDGGRTMTWNVGAGCVGDKLKIESG